jgi:hypothetical protein
MAVGGVLGWNMYEGLGLIWRVLIIPSYAVLMAAVIVSRPLGSWATIPVFVGMLVAGDLLAHGIRRTTRAATDSMDQE